VAGGERRRLKNTGRVDGSRLASSVTGTHGRERRGAARGVVMISARLVEMIEIHANRLTADVAGDLLTNDRTRGFRAVRRADLERRIYDIFHHLGDWIGNPRADQVRAEFADWGGQRFGQGIPLSEIIYAVLLLKRHLRQYIRDHGLVDAAFPRVEREYVLPMHLQSLQNLHTQVDEFFDEALHALASGYEAAAQRAPVG
jgi:hypothetical protein